MYELQKYLRITLEFVTLQTSNMHTTKVIVCTCIFEPSFCFQVVYELVRLFYSFAIGFCLLFSVLEVHFYAYYDKHLHNWTALPSRAFILHENKHYGTS